MLSIIIFGWLDYGEVLLCFLIPPPSPAFYLFTKFSVVNMYYFGKEKTKK